MKQAVAPRRRATRPRSKAASVRVGPLLAIPALLREFGVDPSRVLARAGLDRRTFDDPENRRPFGALARLFAECAAATGCAHFGLLVGQRAGEAPLGIIGELMGHAPSVRAALRQLILHLHLHDGGGVAVLNSLDRDQVALGYVVHHPGSLGLTQIYDLSMAVAFRLMRGLCGPRWSPTEVQLSHRRPADLAPYRRFFGAPLRFDAEYSAIVFTAEWLDRPVARADRASYAKLSRIVAAAKSADRTGLAERVRHAVTGMIADGGVSIGRVAGSLSLNPRTLHRRLKAEGTGTRAVLHDVRHELARQMLRETRLQISEIAAALVYADPSSFCRAFKSWAGATPSAWRRNAVRAAAGRPARNPRSA